MTAVAVQRALARGEARQALALALDSWRRERAPEIATAIDALDRAAAASFEAPVARTKDGFQEAWLAAVRSGEPVALAVCHQCAFVVAVAEDRSRRLTGDGSGHVDTDSASLEGHRLRRGPERRFSASTSTAP